MSDADFSTGASLSLSVPQSELRSVREEIEDELGEVSISVANEGGGGGGHSGRGGRELHRTLDENLRVDHYRNTLLEELLEAIEDDGVSKAKSAGGAIGGAGLGILGIAGAGIAGSISSMLDFEFDQPDWLPPDFQEPSWLPPRLPEPDWTPVDVVEPDWAPISVAKPDWLPLDEPEGSGDSAGDGTGSGDTTGSPDENPGGVRDPPPVPNPPPIEDPDPDSPRDIIDDTIPDDQPAPRDQPVREPGTRPGADPNPAPRPEPDGTGGGSDGGFADVDPREVLAGGAAAGAWAGKALSDVPRGGTTGSPLGIPSPGAFIAQQADRAQDKSPDNRNRIEEKLLELLRRNGGGSQAMTLTADITNDISLDGVTEQQLQQELQSMQSDILRQINSEITGSGRLR